MKRAPESLADELAGHAITALVLGFALGMILGAC